MTARESSWRCALCAGGLVVRGPAHLVTGSTTKGRRRVYGTFLICAPCYTQGAPDPVPGLTRPAADRRAGAVQWLDLAGRGPVLPPGPCVACGLVVVRRAEKLLKGVTCSHACRTSLTRIRHGGRGSGRPCGACGQPVTTGRADSAYCGPACRQKAYRRRLTAAAPPAPAPVPQPVPPASVSPPAPPAPVSQPVPPACAPVPQPVPPTSVPVLVPSPVTAPPKTAPAPRGGSDDELLAAMVPFHGGDGISQTLYKALYQLRTAYRQGPNGRDEALARLASMNPARLKIPPTPDGHRLRAALHTLHDQHAQP